MKIIGTCTICWQDIYTDGTGGLNSTYVIIKDPLKGTISFRHVRCPTANRNQTPHRTPADD